MKHEKLIGEIKELLQSHGFKEDRWSNLKRVKDGIEQRYKFNPTSFRLEIKSSNSWIKLHGAYYKDVVVENNKIRRKK